MTRLPQALLFLLLLVAVEAMAATDAGTLLEPPVITVREGLSTPKSAFYDAQSDLAELAPDGTPRVAKLCRRRPASALTPSVHAFGR